MRFRPGQKVVCIKRGQWKPSPIGPQFNEICTVERLSNYDGIGLVLWEYQQVGDNGGREPYDPLKFEPLIEDSILEAELQSIPQLKRV